ncbi:unnamed protein product [Heterobilharzia americana]|nr:unnamed protein product [Heterobilharzia americana]CAH8609952.1 unnamed protein product [Heterobilharzia americana]
MWYEILPSVGIMIATIVVTSPIITLTTYAMYGRWHAPDVRRYKQDLTLHLRDRDLGGMLLLQGTEVVDDE